MSETEARERYYWSKIRQQLKRGNVGNAGRILLEAALEDGATGKEPDLTCRLYDRIAETFTAGCAALGDPAPTEQEQDHA